MVPLSMCLSQLWHHAQYSRGYFEGQALRNHKDAMQTTLADLQEKAPPELRDLGSSLFTGFSKDRSPRYFRFGSVWT